MKGIVGYVKRPQRSKQEKMLDMEKHIEQLWKKSELRKGSFKRTRYTTKELSGLYSELKKEVM